VEKLLLELRYAVRSLRKDWRVTTLAVITLAIGIGAATTIFSAFYNLLFHSFPYKNADRLVSFAIRNVSNEGSSAGRSMYSEQEYRAFQSENRVFDDMVGYERARSVLYNDGNGTRALPGMARVTGNTFNFYGVPALSGRAISEDDDRPEASPVFVMNYKLWRNEFNSDPSVIGKSFVLNGEPRTLIGVMPPRFDLYDVSLWVPLIPGSSKAMPEIVGRLREGVTLQAAAAGLSVIAHQLTSNEPGFALNPRNYEVTVERLVDTALAGFDKALYALLGAVLLLLLIACTNVANLLLARATLRDREIALRSALGASRARLLRHVLIETFVLSVFSCVVGCIFAALGVRLVQDILPAGSVPDASVIALNWPVLGFAMGMALLTTVVCGLVPALRASRRDLYPTLVVGGKGVSGDRKNRVRAAIVVLQVALSMVLLTGAGLLMRDFFTLTHVTLPFDPAKTLYVELALPKEHYYGHPDPKPAFFRQVLPRLQAIPGVLSVAESLMLPPNEGSWTDVDTPGKPHTERWVTDFEFCTEDYFKTLGLQLRYGRLLSTSDVEAKHYVAVVNETLAHRYFDGQDPVGKKIKFEVLDRPFIDGPHHVYFEIVGVVADFKSRPEGRNYVLRPEAFLPASTAGFGYPLHILARTAVDPHELMKVVQREVWAVDPDVAFSGSGSIADLLSREFSSNRFELVTMGSFAGVGLMLAVTGIFGVMSYSVSLRMQEIGIRMALGAERGKVIWLILNRGLSLVASGIVLGTLASVALTRYMASLLWSVSPKDPWTFVLTGCAILGVGVTTCLVPARRASRLDPIAILRAE
jgi:putative ABC transport system permease protein